MGFYFGTILILPGQTVHGLRSNLGLRTLDFEQRTSTNNEQGLA